MGIWRTHDLLMHSQENNDGEDDVRDEEDFVVAATQAVH
jgi:hypothetical protein